MQHNMPTTMGITVMGRPVWKISNKHI
jgi:hypothetical protein